MDLRHFFPRTAEKTAEKRALDRLAVKCYLYRTCAIKIP